MSQAESLLNSIAAYPTTAAATVSTSPINDYLVIDAEGRIINVPATEILFGVETDLNAERKYFRCPRIVGDNIDLITLGLRVHYRNAQGEKDGYIVDDVKVSGEFIEFSWLLGGKLFKSKGTVYFAVCAVSVDEEGYETCEWNTTLASGTVLEGLDIDLSTSEYAEASDLLQQLLSLLQTRSNEAVQAVTDEGTRQIANVETAGSEQRTLIESKGAETLATIPEDYTATYNAADDALRKKAPAILLEEEGTVISVSDASDDYVRGLKVFGKTEQKTYTGKNLLENTIYDMSYNGITITKNSDKSFYVNGTATDNCYFQINGTGLNLSEGRYRLSGCDSNSSTSTYILYGTNDDIYVQDVGEGVEFDYSSELVLPIRFAVYKGAVMNNVLIKPMITLASVEDTSYEPYTGGIASPNPDYPQELESIENTTVRVCGKNLLRNTRETDTLNGVTFTFNDDRSIVANGTATDGVYFNLSTNIVLPPGTYHLSGSAKGGSADTYYTYLYPYYYGDYSGEEGRTFTIYETITFTARIFVAKGFTCNNLVFKPQIELGSAATEYEPYNDQSIAIPQSLRRMTIPSTNNTTGYTVCDEVDFERGVYIQRIKQLVLNSSQYWWDYVGTALEGEGYCYVVTLDDCKPGLYTSLCTHFNNSPFAWDYRYAGRYSDHASLVNKYFITDISSMTDFVAWLDEQEANGTPVVLNYVLTTPIETPLTSDELNAFRALHTNYPNTVVMNNGGATTQLIYNADTKLFVLQNGGGGGTTVSKISVTLSASKWTASSDGTYYTQNTGIAVDDNVKVDLQPTAAQLVELLSDGISMFLSNESGYIVAYAIGGTPASDMTIQATETVVIYV